MKPKSGSVVQCTLQADGNIKFDVIGAGELILHMDRVSVACKDYARFHGFNQRGVDAAALPCDTATGKPAPASEKYTAIKRIVDHLETGTEEWNMGGGEGGGKSITLEAIARVQGVTYEEAEARVEKHAKEKFEGDVKKTLAFLRTGARVMTAMDAIRKERTPAAKIDADEALDALKAA